MAITTDNYTLVFSNKIAKWLVSLYLIYLLAGHTYHEVRGVVGWARNLLIDIEYYLLVVVIYLTRPFVKEQQWQS